jgi:uncharacterized protein with von Willebrand factor type A (vWA) domain
MEPYPFSEFEHFGAIGDAEQRRALADELFSRLVTGDEIGQDWAAMGMEHFSKSLTAILSHQNLRTFCCNESDISIAVENDILKFIADTEKELLRNTPFLDELNRMHEVKTSNWEVLSDRPRSTFQYLEKAYPEGSFDLKIYSEELRSAQTKKPERSLKITLGSIRQHLLDRWEGLLQKKHLAWQLAEIDKRRKAFTDDLYQRLEELKRLQEALEPFNQQLGRLWDLSKGGLQRVNFDLLKQYAELLKRDKALQELAQMLGRMQQAEREMEEETYTDMEINTVWKLDHAQKSELIGIRESDDLSAMLPSESALLADPDLEMLFYKRFAEKKLQTYDYQARIMDEVENEVERKRQKAKENKGPIIICVDTSGSMHGTPETIAKTMCFALLKVALQEQRKCYLISFSTQIATLDLTDFQHSLPKLLDFLGMSFHHGTDADPAFREALRMLEQESYKKADVLMVSDFVMGELDTTIKARIATAKGLGTKFHSLVIGASQNNRVLADFDHSWTYDPSRKEALGEILKAVWTR